MDQAFADRVLICIRQDTGLTEKQIASVAKEVWFREKGTRLVVKDAGITEKQIASVTKEIWFLEKGTRLVAKEAGITDKRQPRRLR